MVRGRGFVADSAVPFRAFRSVFFPLRSIPFLSALRFIYHKLVYKLQYDYNVNTLSRVLSIIVLRLPPHS